MTIQIHFHHANLGGNAAGIGHWVSLIRGEHIYLLMVRPSYYILGFID